MVDRIPAMTRPAPLNSHQRQSTVDARFHGKHDFQAFAIGESGKTSNGTEAGGMPGKTGMPARRIRGLFKELNMKTRRFQV
jgi:hypothetical protein